MITQFHLISHAPLVALWKLLCSYLERFIRLESATPADDQIYWELAPVNHGEFSTTTRLENTGIPLELTIFPSRPWKA